MSSLVNFILLLFCSTAEPSRNFGQRSRFVEFLFVDRIVLPSYAALIIGTKRLNYGMTSLHWRVLPAPVMVTWTRPSIF